MARLRCCSSRNLSYAGRLQLVKSVLHTLHVYWASAFLLPKGVLEEIEKVCRHYFCAGNDMSRKPALVSWEEVCRPKHSGGLGIKNLLLWNTDALGVHVWNVANKKDMLWVKWVSEIYLQGETIWEHQPKIDSSWQWKKLNKVKDQLVAGFDRGRWTAAATGMYSIASGYRFLQGDMPKETFSAKLWKSKAIPKHIFIVWLAARRRLVTIERLKAWGDRVTD